MKKVNAVLAVNVSVSGMGILGYLTILIILKMIKEYACEQARPPKEVTDAYHKHDCLAVLGHGDAAVIQLARWIKHMESQGTVTIEDYNRCKECASHSIGHLWQNNHGENIT